MIPILYEGNETEFLTNGIGRLSDAIACTVEENLNGLYELEMQYPITGIHYGDIEVDRLILATPFDGGDPQPFRIYQISRAINGIVTINAEHISYLLNRVVVMPFQATSCATALDGLKSNAANNCPFTFSTTKTGSSTFTVSEPQPLRALLGGQKGSILDVYGKGEYEFDRWNVRLSTSRGSDQGVTLRYGKNLTELVRDSDISNAYTGIVPFWANADGGLVTLPEKIIWSEHRNAFAHEIVKAVDFSSEWQEAPTVAQLRTRATAYVTANEGWTVSDNIKVSFVALWQTDEYKNIAVLERVHMGDTVKVVYEALGVEASAKVIRTVYDVLLERFDEIELGTAKNTLAQAIAEPILEEVPTSSDMEQAIAHGTRLITGGLGGYVYMKPNASGQPEEILVMDDPDYTQATKLWRFNKNGIGFSKTGYNGEYKYAWTMDGAFYTDWVSTGKMTANLIKTGKITGQESGSMTIDVDAGTITLGNSNKLRITAGNFKLDSSGNVSITGKFTSQSGNVKTMLDTGIMSVYRNNSLMGKLGMVTFNSLPAMALECDNANGLALSIGSTAYYVLNRSGMDYTGYGFSHYFRGDLYTESRYKMGNGYGWGHTSNKEVGIGCDVRIGAEGAYGFLTVLLGCWVGGEVSCDSLEQRSDRNLKQEIEDLSKEEAKRVILNLRPVTYRWRKPTGHKEPDTRLHHGFIAQEMQEIVSNDWGIVTDREGGLTLNYTELLADAVSVIQQQQTKIDELETRLARLEALLEGDGK